MENRGRDSSFQPKSLSSRYYPHLFMPCTEERPFTPSAVYEGLLVMQERPQLASFHGLTSQLPSTTGVVVQAIQFGPDE